ncbi:MAG TPA: DUF2218 domain-containing protein [Dermatophilaceae bacterium]|nr:DUF2218 domain-containing protein [Dermatophilaceae bacterium]
MPSASAFVATDRSARYVKQLVSHFSGKVDAELAGDSATFRFSSGTAVLHAGEAGIRIEARAASEEELARLRDVVTRHLVRFGNRDELTVQWEGPEGGR